MKEELDFTKDVTIDKYALDDEWLKQSSLICRYLELLADAKVGYDMTKEAVEILYANKDIMLRQEGGKNTEESIKKKLKADLEIQQAEQDLIKARFDVNKIQAAVSALEHKKSALEQLVKLHGIGYFSIPQDK